MNVKNLNVGAMSELLVFPDGTVVDPREIHSIEKDKSYRVGCFNIDGRPLAFIHGVDDEEIDMITSILWQLRRPFFDEHGNERPERVLVKQPDWSFLNDAAAT